MHGRGGEEEERRRSWHMWPVPALGKAVPLSNHSETVEPVAAVTDSKPLYSRDFFLKDGRKIRVGDCALFQSGNSPAFIGIIRWFSSNKEDFLKLGVNWLYRPADVRLTKGILLEAAPNEVFYSFHKDEISAESLLHPCKVAFLRKGVELPTGISSFVCRRVYDTTNKCLWWLTDQDYINERQEEVDQLLDKTRLEMHAAVQSGGRSPKQLNASASVQQVKSGSDTVQNAGTSIALPSKGKRKDKAEQGSDAGKRDLVPKVDNEFSGSQTIESMINFEIAKVTDRGALMDIEEVEKLVNLMQLYRSERRIDFAGRVLLANVIASTDRLDCLGRFVQLRGVLVLDDWLQEAHKGKPGEISSPRESDKSVEELLLALLRALDKLPVNLYALQTSNIGKSVNHLRTHKNLEIQKKARSLVDTWKKRVDAEMTKINDAKSVGHNQVVSWSGKPGFPEVCHGANRQPGSSEVSVKLSVSQASTCKNFPGKGGHVDSAVKSSAVAPGTPKLPSNVPSSVAACSKDVSKPTGTSGSGDSPLTAMKEEKSSGSSQSQNNSQSCSSGHAKACGTSWREDVKSSSAGSLKSSKTSGAATRHRKSNHGTLGSGGVSGVQKDASLGKSGSFNRGGSSNKLSQAGTPERMPDFPGLDRGNGHKLIVRLPNPRRSPAGSTSGGSFEEPSVVCSRASSPGVSVKQEQNDHKNKVNSDTCQMKRSADGNAELWQSNDVKGATATGPDENERHQVNLDGELQTIVENGKNDALKTVCSSANGSLTDSKSGKACDPSFSSINALIESCVKYRDENTSLPDGDDVGMNLLASVAAEEMCKSDLVSPASPVSSALAREEPADSDDCRAKFPYDNREEGTKQTDSSRAANSEEHANIVSSVQVGEELQKPTRSMVGPCTTFKNKTVLHENKSSSEQEDSCPKLESKPDQTPFVVELPSTSTSKEKDESAVDKAIQLHEKRKTDPQGCTELVEIKVRILSDENTTCGSPHKKKTEISRPTTNTAGISLDSRSSNFHDNLKKLCSKEAVEKQSCFFSEKDIPNKTNATSAIEEQQTVPAVNPYISRGIADALDSSSSCRDSTENVGGLVSENSDVNKKSHVEPMDCDCSGKVILCSVGEEDTPKKEAFGNQTIRSLDNEELAALTRDIAECTNAVSLPRMEGNETADTFSLPDDLESDNAEKLVFDLNEGIPADDDTKQGELIVSGPTACSSLPNVPSLTACTVSPLPNGSPISVTIAAPAKGPFVPPENLFTCKGEPGWKGSAATSAFRPAEPRKVPEMPLNTTEGPIDSVMVRQIRPPLDIDLNVADERVFEDMDSQTSAPQLASEFRNVVGLDLDLNKSGEVENGQQLAARTCRKIDLSSLPARSVSEVVSNGKTSSSRNFDLNNGPSNDEVAADPMHNHLRKSHLTFPLSGGASRMNNDAGNVPWFIPGNAYSSVAIPSFLPERGDQSYPIVTPVGAQRYLGSATGGVSFGCDIYRRPVLSSSPAVSFSPTAGFSYTNFPFGSSFPLAATSFTGGPTTYMDSSAGGGPCFPSIHSQLVGPANAASSTYMRPNVTSLLESSSSGGGSESGRKWGRQSLDLNAGPGAATVEGRDERLASASRQFSVASLPAFAEDEAKIFQVPDGTLKRKEPDGGWDAERYSFKQPSWQ